MLKGNLSTRPFYNDRLVTMAIAACALVLLVLTVVNVTQLVTLSRERAAIRARLTADLNEADRIQGEAEALQGSVDRTTLAQLASSAREANQLIDRRTFSWTQLLGQLEHTLPAGVRLMSISPRADRGAFRISLSVVARDLDDIETFMAALRDTGRFYDVVPSEQRLVEDGSGSYRAVVDASHLGQSTPSTAEAVR